MLLVLCVFCSTPFLYLLCRLIVIIIIIMVNRIKSHIEKFESYTTKGASACQTAKKEREDRKSSAIYEVKTY